MPFRRVATATAVSTVLAAGGALLLDLAASPPGFLSDTQSAWLIGAMSVALLSLLIIGLSRQRQREGGIVWLVWRLVAGGASLAVLFGSLLLVGSLMETLGPLSYRAMEGIGPPWVVRHEREDTAYTAVNASPMGSLTVLAEASESTSADSEVPPDYVSMQVQVQISGSVTNPLIAAVRDGRIRDGSSVVAATAGSIEFGRYGPALEAPIVNVSNDAATLVIQGRALMSRNTAMAIGLSPPLHCDAIASRTFTVTVTNYVLAGSSTDALSPSALDPACGSGTWLRQDVHSAQFHGNAFATLELDAPTTAGQTGKPLIPRNELTDQVLATLLYGALGGLPLLIAFVRLRRFDEPQHQSIRTIASIIGAFLALLAIAVGLTTLDPVYSTVVDLAQEAARSSEWYLSAPSGLIPAAMIVFLAIVWRRTARSAVIGSPRRSTSELALLASAAIVIVASSISGLRGASDLAGELGYAGNDSGHLADWAIFASPILAAAALIAVVALGALSAAMLATVCGSDGRTALTAAAGAGLTMAMLVIAPASNRSGLLGVAVGVTPPILAGTATWLALETIVRRGINTNPPQSWTWLRMKLRGWRGLRIALAVVFSLPFLVYSGPDQPPIGWYDFESLVQSIIRCLPILTLLLLIVVVRDRGSAEAGGTTTRGPLSEIAATATLIAVVGLLTPYATVIGIPVAFLLGWFLLSRWLIRAPRDDIYPPVGPGQRSAADAAVLELAYSTAASRAIGSLERGIRKQLAEETLTVNEQASRLERLSDLAMLGRDRARLVREALSNYGGVTPWERARRLGLAGLVIGLPWTVVDIAALIRVLTDGGQFRISDGLTSIPFLLRFATTGLVLGAAYPLIRGRHGLAKGFAVFAALSGPALCINLLPDPRATGVLSASILQIAQLFSVALALGISADLHALRRCGLGWRHLRDLHNLTPLAASVSSVALAAITAAATAIGTGAAGVAVARLVPPTPPAATASSTSGGIVR